MTVKHPISQDDVTELQNLLVGGVKVKMNIEAGTVPPALGEMALELISTALAVGSDRVLGDAISTLLITHLSILDPDINTTLTWIFEQDAKELATLSRVEASRFVILHTDDSVPPAWTEALLARASELREESLNRV